MLFLDEFFAGYCHRTRQDQICESSLGHDLKDQIIESVHTRTITVVGEHGAGQRVRDGVSQLTGQHSVFLGTLLGDEGFDCPPEAALVTGHS